jgi:hypothetical protein
MQEQSTNEPGPTARVAPVEHVSGRQFGGMGRTRSVRPAVGHGSICAGPKLVVRGLGERSCCNAKGGVSWVTAIARSPPRDDREPRLKALVVFVRSTWLATTVFLVSTAIWWLWLDGVEALRHGLPILLIAPAVWWAGVARKQPLQIRRGLIAGAFIGLVTQLLPHAQVVRQLLSHRGGGDGETQAIAVASAVISMVIGLGGLTIGAASGLLAAAIQKRGDRWALGSV